MILGIDVSTYPEELEHGARYFDGGAEIDPLDAFREGGVDHMRIRVWNDPYSENGEPYLAGSCNMDNYVRLASLAKAKGYKLLMDLHYSDFWADPGKQMIPKAWRGMGIDELEEAVYRFTLDCLRRAAKTDTLPDMIQVGNEITCGMLWPIGKLESDGARGNYESFCRLVSAGCRACREAAPSAEIVLHLERSNDTAVYTEFFSEMEKAGIDYDIIGASYYPYWHGTPEELFANLSACRARFKKKIMVMELGYGFTLRPYTLDGEEKRLVIDEDRAYVKGFTEKYPVSPEGQAAFVEDFLRGAEAIGVSGVFYWEPLWLPGEGICWASAAGQEYIGEQGKSTSNEWANQCLFDYFGNKLPAFDKFRIK